MSNGLFQWIIVFTPFSSQFENLQRSQKRLTLFVPLTLALIFLALLALFGYDAGHALIVMANVPLAAVGGIAALGLRHMNLSISAGVGFVSLAGVSVMAGVLWLGHLNRMKKEGGDLLARVVEGSAVQFRPVFLVLIIAVIGLLPAALNSGVGSDILAPPGHGYRRGPSLVAPNDRLDDTHLLFSL